MAVVVKRFDVYLIHLDPKVGLENSIRDIGGACGMAGVRVDQVKVSEASGSEESFLLLGGERARNSHVRAGEKVWNMDPGGMQMFSPRTSHGRYNRLLACTKLKSNSI